MERKKVFITGSGSGLGKEAAIKLARRGHTVYASVLYSCQIDELEQIAKKEGLDLKVFTLNILNVEDRNQILDYDIDVLICNAAIGESGSVSEIPVSKIRDVFETNIFCNLDLVELALKNMILKKKKGRIVFLSSLAGRIPMTFLSAYCASKAAIEMFATCLKNEMKLLNKLYKTDISVSIIEPGAYATGFNKENNEKKYEWMQESSYFIKYIPKLRIKEKKLWNFLEKRRFTSIINKYVHAVEDKKAKSRYTAPFFQAFFIQIGRVFGK